MKTTRAQNLMAVAFVCGLSFASTNLFAQEVPVPVGPPAPVGIQDFSFPNAAAPLVAPQGPWNGGVHLGQSFDGIDFLGSNCHCLPPDTNAAVGNDFVVETVNVQIRIFDRITGMILLNEPLSTFFGAPSQGDPYVVYDDNADRWYVSAFGSGVNVLFLAVSSDGNPLHGFKTYHLTDVGGFADYSKLGFNRDAIFISYNDFGTGGGAAATIVSIDKEAILSGTLIHFISKPKFQFRAMPPAQMHGDHEGEGREEWGDGQEEKGKGVEWFVSTDGTDAGGSTIRVTRMTHYLSNSPQFTYTSLPVTPFKRPIKADQPGGTVTTFPNTTTTQVHYRKGRLVTALASGTASDGFVYPKGMYYEIKVKGEDDEDDDAAAPKLLKEGVIDPGPGVAVQMASVDEDKEGNLGLTWMESSKNEHLSMWVGNVNRKGKLTAEPAAPGLGLFFASFRIGDYSAIVLDPSDGRTFWGANEYIGANGNTDIWLTHITSFTARKHDHEEDDDE